MGLIDVIWRDLLKLGVKIFVRHLWVEKGPDMNFEALFLAKFSIFLLFYATFIGFYAIFVDKLPLRATFDKIPAYLEI